MRSMIWVMPAALLIAGCGSSSSSPASPSPTKTRGAVISTVPVTTPIATPHGGFPTAKPGSVSKLPTVQAVSLPTPTTIPASAYTATLHGTVTDAKSGSPIPGAIVAIGTVKRRIAMTDSFGKYRIAFPGAVSVPVTATVSGYIQQLEIGSLRAHQTYTLNFKLARAVKGQAPSPPSIFGRP